MIFAFGHVSGGHYNPAVTLGLAAAGQFGWDELPGYWSAQLVGAGLAAAVARVCYSPEAARAMVIATVATDRRAPWNGAFAPVAIGLFIFTAAVVIGPFTSGSFNPARSVAPAVVNGAYDHLALFVVGPLVGGYVGGLVHAALRGDAGR